ncbi:MAG TPA: hypothetical protein PKY30_23670, partial [Myxococcota bacterium]|nr:hypothetical protein [Myxococcota bacterium]
LAEEHLELRKQMVQETKKLLEDVEGALASATDWGTKAEGYLERIKGEKGLGERQQLTGVIEQMRERNKAQVDRLQVFYKKFTQSGGPLMNSRVDFRGLSQLPTGEQADYKKNSGAYFRQASATMEEVSTKMSALASADGKLEELMEQAQALIGGGMSPTEALVRLEDIRMDSEAVVEGIARRFTKLEQTLDRTNQVWTTVISGSEELKAQRLKSLTMKIAEVDKLVEAIKQQKEPLDRINRRITSIPEDVKGDKAVAKAIDDILKEVSGARLKLRQMPTLLTNWKNLRTEAETALGVGA